MFAIQYYLVDGQEINYQCSGDTPTMEDVNSIALMYANLRPNDLPDSVFANVRLYAAFTSMMFNNMNHVMKDTETGIHMLHIHTSVGVLRVIPMPMASDGKLFLVGKREDFDRYDIDKIFEQIVLKDCEVEEYCEHKWEGATGEGYCCIKCGKGHIGS